MIFSLFGEIGLIIIGTLYVLDCWFDSCINLMDWYKNNEEADKDKELPEAVKHMFS